MGSSERNMFFHWVVFSPLLFPFRSGEPVVPSNEKSFFGQPLEERWGGFLSNNAHLSFQKGRVIGYLITDEFLGPGLCRFAVRGALLV